MEDQRTRVGSIMEVVFLGLNDEKYKAYIIHQEDDYFGAYVYDTNEFVVGHPDRNIAKDENEKVIFSYDHKHHLDELFDSRGNIDSYLLNYFKNPDLIASYLSMARLITPQENA